MAANDMVKKEFTPEQIQQILNALEMAKKSYERRINAESDLDAKGVWQKKVDSINVLASKVRLTQ